MAGDFALGSIEGAVSIPVDASKAHFDEIVAELDPSKPVTLFCQSSGCSYSDVMAIGKASKGFDQLFIFDGGYAEYQFASDALANEGPH